MTWKELNYIWFHQWHYNENNCFVLLVLQSAIIYSTKNHCIFTQKIKIVWRSSSFMWRKFESRFHEYYFKDKKLISHLNDFMQFLVWFLFVYFLFNHFSFGKFSCVHVLRVTSAWHRNKSSTSLFHYIIMNVNAFSPYFDSSHAYRHYIIKPYHQYSDINEETREKERQWMNEWMKECMCIILEWESNYNRLDKYAPDERNWLQRSTLSRPMKNTGLRVFQCAYFVSISIESILVHFNMQIKYL